MDTLWEREIHVFHVQALKLRRSTKRYTSDAKVVYTHSVVDNNMGYRLDVFRVRPYTRVCELDSEG